MAVRRIISHRTCILMCISLVWLCAGGAGYAHVKGKFLANSGGSASISSKKQAGGGRSGDDTSIRDTVSGGTVVVSENTVGGNAVGVGTVAGGTVTGDRVVGGRVGASAKANGGVNVGDSAKGGVGSKLGGVRDIESQPVGSRDLSVGRVGAGKDGKTGKTDLRGGRGIRGSRNDVRNVPGVPSVWQVILALSVVLVVIVAVSYIFRRYLVGMRQGSGGGVIEILAHSAINPKQSLCLVKLGERMLLLGISQGHIARLDVVDNPDEVAMILGRIEESSAQSISGSFRKLFHRESLSYEMDDDSLFDIDDGDVKYGDGKVGGGIGDEELSDREKLLRDSSGELNGLLDKVKAMTRMGFRGGK